MARLYEGKQVQGYSTSGKHAIEEGKQDHGKHDDTIGSLRTGDVDIEHLYPLGGCYCCIVSLFPAWPECLGCAGRNTLCCLQSDLILCKKARSEKAYCLCLKAELECIPCHTCILSRTQICCFDTRISIPPEAQVPKLLNICGTTCYPGCFCCANLSTLTGDS